MTNVGTHRLAESGNLAESRQSLDSNEGPRSNRTRVLSGKLLVLGLFAFGIAATSLLYVYWDQHTKPFRPLREAIGREFRHSRPNVEGGRHKGRGPWTLRISLTVPFPPAEEPDQSKKVFDRILEITRQNLKVDDIEKIEVNLIQFVPEELARTLKMTWPDPAGR